MSITEEVSYDKDGHIVRYPAFKHLFLPLTIILVALLSFGLGRLSVVGKREAVRIEFDSEMANDEMLISNQTPSQNITKPQTANAIQSIQATQTSTQVVVSKNGTKYHYLHCGGAKQIKEENKITFDSPQAAEAAGYTLAANCSPR